MVSGTSKISLNLDPRTRYLWLLLYRDTSKNIIKYTGTSWNNIIFGNLIIKNSKIGSCVYPALWFLNFWTLKCWNLGILKFWNYGSFKLYFVKLRTNKHKDWLNKIEKNLDMIFISIKKHDIAFCQFLFPSKRTHKMFFWKYLRPFLKFWNFGILELIHIAT